MLRVECKVGWLRVFAVAISLLTTSIASLPASAQVWGASWTAPPTRGVRTFVDISPAWTSPVIRNQTIVQKVRLSAGGDRLRLRLSNQYGDRPLAIGRVRIRMVDKSGSLVANSEREATFSQSIEASVSPGAVLLSDPIPLQTPALAYLEIAIYLPGDAWPCTCHADGRATSRISPAGDFTDRSFVAVSETRARAFLVGIDVEWKTPRPVIAAIGDSLTDGYGSTLDLDQRWPDRLAQRLATDANAPAVINLGISGNRVISDDEFAAYGPNVLARFDRDVLATPGVTHIVVLEGINDIGADPAVSSQAMIAAYRQIIERAHQRKIKVYLGTLMPFGNSPYPRPEGETVRQALNKWMRSQTEADGIIDFDKLMRDPASPGRLKNELQSDWLHLNDAGYTAMADGIELNLFR